MVFGHHSAARRYDLSALGLLNGPPLKAASIVTETAWESLQAASAAFIVFDAESGEAVIHAKARLIKNGTRYPLHRSALAAMGDTLDQVLAIDLSQASPPPAERTEFGMVSMLAATVAGPDRYPLGALVAFDTKVREWSPMKAKQLKDLAYLITQEVMLHASFATLELMADEQARFKA
ncbi:MAG: hypothetical protein AAGK71_06645 [Pseudomonadota bacterium]